MRRVQRENGDEFLVASSGFVARVLPLPSPAREADEHCTSRRYDPGLNERRSSYGDPYAALRASGTPRAGAR